MQKLVIPIQHRGFPREAQKMFWSMAGFIALAALWTDSWKGGWHLIGWLAISLLECILLAKPLRRMIAPAELCGHSLAGIEHVSVEILGEGEATWFDPAGLPMGLAPGEGWNCWLALLSRSGFPAFIATSACFRLRLEGASAATPMPRRHPEQSPDRRPSCDQSFPRPSNLPFRFLLAFFLFLLMGSVGVAVVGDPMLAAFGGGPITTLTGLILLLVWLDERRSIRSLRWDGSMQNWTLSAFSGGVTTWSPESPPMALKKLFGSGSRVPSLTSDKQSQSDALALFLDDQAHAAWWAKRRQPVFTHSKLEQDSL
jgi:hypothetical protein